MLIIRHIAALSVLDDPALQKTKPHTGDEYGMELVAPGRRYTVLGSILHVSLGVGYVTTSPVFEILSESSLVNRP